MQQTVLVTFATRFGSTAETAQGVAQTLRDYGLAAELLHVNEVASIERYGAIVLGAALYMGRLHKDARRFLQMQRPTLEKLPVALFVPGPVEEREKDFEAGRRQLAKELARFPWFKPVACEVVGGTFNPNTLGLPWKFIPALKKIPVSDARDWAKIRAWASTLPGVLVPDQPHLISR